MVCDLDSAKWNFNYMKILMQKMNQNHLSPIDYYKNLYHFSSCSQDFHNQNVYTA